MPTPLLHPPVIRPRLPPPSAPARSRRLPTRQAAASPVNNTASADADQLADDLFSLRITTATKPKPSSAATSRRPPPSSRPLAPTKPLAAKAAPPAPATALSPTEQGKQAMRTVNTSLQTLSGVSKSGWRAAPTSAAPSSCRPAPLKSASASSSLSSVASASQSRERVDAAAEACGAALKALRQLIREGKINNRATEVEKAAGSLVANLVEMELYELALTELASMRVSILSWYDSDASLRVPPPLKPFTTTKGKSTLASRRPSLLTYAHVLSLPFPAPSFFDPPTLSEALSSTAARPLAQDIVPLVLAVQQYTLGCLFRAELSAEEVARRPEVVWEQLGGHGNPCDWRRKLEEHMAEGTGESVETEGVRRRVDAMMTSMFGTLTKGCVAMDQVAPPDVLLSLRSRALLFFATTRPLYAEQAKLDAFYDQTRKVLLLFGRRSEEKQAGETKINEGVKRIFEEVVEVLVQKQAKMEGKAWVTLCEVVLHIAKRADDSAMVERVSLLIDSKALAFGTVDPEAQVSQLCAKFVSALSVLEAFCKSGEDKGVADQLRRTVTAIPILSNLRSQDLAPESHTKIDKVLERLRYVAARQFKGGRRLDQWITNAGDAKPVPSEVEIGLLGLLKALAGHIEVLHKAYSKSSPPRPFNNRKTLYEGAVESHLILAYSQLVVDDRISFTHAFANLEQSLPLIAATTTTDSLLISDLENAYSLRTLASAYYNIGGTLYNAGKPEAAIRFIKRSCQIGKAALEAATRGEDAFLSTGEEDSSRLEALADLRKHMQKRWELLALAQQAIGEKHLAYDAYVSAITALSDDSKVTLGRIAATSSISALVVREANLFKLVQRSTKLAAFDLLLPGPKTSLRERLSGAGYSTSASAAIIELQVVSLEPNLDKIEAFNTIPALLNDLLELYTPAQFPMRRARTLVRRLQHSCAPSSSPEDHSLVEDPAEIAGLCSPKTPIGEDAALRSFASQYLAFSHIWLGFNAHQAQLPSASESTSQAAREGLRILRDAFDKDIPPSPSKPLAAATKPTPKPTPKKAIPTTRRAATKVADKAAFKTPKMSRTLPGSRSFKPELVTPPSKGAIDLTHRSTPPRGEVIALLLDDPDRSYASLETMANLLGALGYSLLRISYLRFLRRLTATLHSQARDAAYVSASAYLGHEYVRLGKTSRAGVVFAQAEIRIQACAKAGRALASASHVTYLTHYAEYLAVVGNRDRSSKAYLDAHQLALTLTPDDSSLSVPNRIVERTLLLQRSASAAGVCSVMLQRRGDLTRALNPAMQALRVWTRVLNNISRLSAQEQPTSDASSAFTSSTTDKNAPLADFPNGSRKRQPAPSSGPNAGLVWQVSESLASALLRVAALHSIRGNPKSAEHYAQQAIDFAQDLGSTRLFARALVVRAEVRLHAGNFVDASSDLDLVDQVLGEKQTSCPEAIDAHRIRADLLMRDPTIPGAAKDAQAYYLEAQKSLDSFVEAAEAGEVGRSPSKLASPGRTTVVKFSSPIRPSPTHPSPSPGRHHPASDSILPTLHAYLLRMRVGLLQTENCRNKDDECQMLLRRLSKYGTSDEDRADELKLLASIQFQKLLSRLNSDAVLQALPEAVLSMPTFGVLAAKAGSPSSGSSLLHCLRDVEVLLADAVALSLSRAEPTKLRELSLLTANLRAVQASVGPTSKQSIPVRVASVLDLGLAVTLRREMLDAIDRKLAGSAAPDDIEWPTPDLPTSASHESLIDASRPMLDFWTSARERYRTESAEPTMTDPTLSTILPPNWTVVSLHLATERDCLLAVRHRHGSNPLIFKLPLDRFARREDEEEESFTYDVALGELRDIIVASNAGAQNAKDVAGKDARAAWWKERKDLDMRLQNLTLMMEESWLGAFKTVFLDARHFTPESLAIFKSQIERVMKRTVIRSAKKTTRFKLDDSIVACLSALSPAARDEDIEDVFYFMLESLQFSGMPVAIDEIEVDQVVCDLRTPLEELHAANANSTPVADEHTFLILDKTIQSFPWESIPCLRGRSISRLPSVAFLRDRIALAGVLADASPDGAASTPRHEILVDSSRTSFVLNPSGDLKTTQNNFEPWLEKMKGAGWSGIVGRAPSEEEVKVALSTRDLFLYFGHGGAEQFVRSQTVRNLERCAVTMLWGCSSGLLKDLGDFDPVGTPYHYMVAGCPALVANLWDVTDKDIDKFSDAVFRKLGLDGEPRDEDDARPTLAGAVGGSRDVCLLRYLNGAAPVVYGVPVRFSRIVG